jgi:hypothetical protein
VYIMLKILLQPYPFQVSLRKHLILNFWIGCFIAFFLIAFQPFNTNLWHDDYKNWKLSGYGIVSFLMPTLWAWLLLTLSNPNEIEKKWTVWKELFFVLTTIVSIAFANMLYAVLLGGNQFGLSSFFGFLISVMMLGFFPVMANILLKFNRFKALNEKEALELDENLQYFQQKSPTELTLATTIENEQVELIAENEKDSICLVISDLVYIETADNYANIVFWKGSKLQKELLRGTLKRFEQQIGHPSVLRCHRSFIVNLAQVEHISGNAQGYRLSLKNQSDIIPVARNFGAIILERLKSKA